MNDFELFDDIDLIVVENALSRAFNVGMKEPNTFPGAHLNQLRDLLIEVHAELKKRGLQ